jgi:hypothetical protein
MREAGRAVYTCFACLPALFSTDTSITTHYAGDVHCWQHAMQKDAALYQAPTRPLRLMQHEQMQQPCWPSNNTNPFKGQRDSAQARSMLQQPDAHHYTLHATANASMQLLHGLPYVLSLCSLMVRLLRMCSADSVCRPYQHQQQACHLAGNTVVVTKADFDAVTHLIRPSMQVVCVAMSSKLVLPLAKNRHSKHISVHRRHYQYSIMQRID